MQANFRFFSVALAIVATVFATPFLAHSHEAASKRKAVSPVGEYARLNSLVGHVTHVGKGQDSHGNGFVIGTDGCHVLTNTHVAFGTGFDKKTRHVILVEDPAIGYEVEFSYQLDETSGKFLRKTTATVVEFGAYEEGTEDGLLQDITILRLKDCAGAAGIPLHRPDSLRILPSESLTTVSVMTDESSGKNRLIIEKPCFALPATGTAGTMMTTCEAPPGSSGSMILGEFPDGLRIMGMGAKQIIFRNGQQLSRMLYASRIHEFLKAVPGLNIKY